MSELLWVDFCSCAYEVANSETAGGLYMFHRYHNRQYQIEAPLPESLNKKLGYIFPRCIVYYMPFVQDPEGFLHDVQHTLLWDERSGGYAAVIKHRRDGPGERTFVWLCLKPNGYVFASLLSIPETAEESKKWQIIRAPLIRIPAGSALCRTVGGMISSQNPNSHKALEAFPAFLAKHKGVCDYLYINSLGIYQDMIASPAQMRGKETGPKEIAMGFISDPKGFTLVLAKEPTGTGWLQVSLTSRAGAARLRERLSGLKKNIGGIRWKQIDVPYGVRVHLDNGVVFYKVIKLRKPEGGKAGYMFEFKADRGKAYIRFPYIFHSSKKVIDFVERVNASRAKIWIRAGRK
jgi:hypothetical protein